MRDESPQVIDLRVECDRRINFAMQQNDVPVVKVLRIENRTDAPLRDLEVRIATEPAFAQGWGIRVAAVGAQAVYNLEAVDLQLSPDFLGELTERVRGQLRAEVHREGELLARCNVAVELLARDEWGGLSSLPEILAAFVLPNHPAVEHVLRSAAEFMSHWTGDPSLNGYQPKDARRVYTTAAAVYAALQKVGLTYVNPPASFEDEGQRVRLPERIEESRMASCLDVALLAAACLEQAGLNTLVVLVRGHAFTGVWLRDECFSEPAVDDCLRLRKRVALSELAVFDPTGVTIRPTIPFERAVTEAKRWLDAHETFLCAIDVRRARKGRIRPLPVRVTRPGAPSESESAAEAAGNEPAAPDVSRLAAGPEPEAGEQESTAETPATRLDRWRRKLLDLSLRNRLLNFRDTKKTLPLQCPDLGQLEDMLAEGAAFRILPRPADLGECDPRDPAAHLRRTGQEAIEELLRDEVKARRLYASTTPEELDRRMIEIYRAARLGLEEGGASALYLALGFLAWYEADQSEQRRLAPILLLPLELHRKSVREGFTLRLADDDPRINVTLLELLKQDHGLVISGLDPLPADESGLDVPQILCRVRQAVRDIDRWDVVNEVRIGLFSFTKFLMWRDLTERAGDLMKNPVVEHLVNRPDQPFDPDGEFPRAERLDEERAPTDTFCPLPADSSQLAAVFAAAEGRSFVLEGPPGTGKSQTITNLIAHCLTEGKTILFVSEKMAALNVVYRRLMSVGLGRYCLELHSNKAHKREVIGQLEEALQRLQVDGQEEWERKARRLSELRNELNAYVQALHQKRSTGETVFQATSRLIGLRDAPRVDLRWPTPDGLDADGLAALRDLIERLATVGANCSEVRGHAWESVRKADWTPGWEEEVHRAITGLGDAADILAERAHACADRLGLAESGWSVSELELLGAITLTLMASPAPPTALLVRPDWDEIQSQVGAWIERGRARDRLRAEVQEQFRAEIVELDLDDLRARLERASASWWPVSWWWRRPIRRTLKRVALDAKAPSKQELAAALDRALALRDEQRRLYAASEEARALLGRYWNDGEAEWDEIAQVRDWARELRALALRATGDDFERGAALRQKWARLASEGGDLLRHDGSIGPEFVAYGEALDAFTRSRSQVAELLDVDVQRVWGADSAPDALGQIRSCVAGWQSAARQLRDWCAWRRARADAMRSNLAPLVEAYEQGEIRSAQLRPVFERSYTQWWLGAVTDRELVLSEFLSPEHQRKIEQFRAVDERYMQLTRLLVQARLAQRVPATSTSVLGFLEYAERGPAAIAGAIQPDPDEDFDSPFEEMVFDALVQRGWEVHKQVGCARYRIDLAVVDPEAPGRYLLGVECDGANYHRAKTARDRDKLREGVLRDLGWRLHRIWSTDWWTDPQREIRKLDEALERAQEAENDSTAPEQTAGRPAEASAPDHEIFALAPAVATSTPAREPVRPEVERYRPMADCHTAGSQADFYEPRAVQAIRARVEEVVRQEGPISLTLAARRVAASWGFERVRSPALDRIRRLIPQTEVRLQVTSAGEFLWPKAIDPDRYRGFRVPDANGNGARQADDLPLEEIGNAAVHLLEHHMSAPLDELIRETARLFGFQRVGRVVDDRIRKAIENLVQRGIARLEGEVVGLL